MGDLHLLPTAIPGLDIPDLDKLPCRYGPMPCPKCGEDITAEPTISMIPWLGCGRCVPGIEERMGEDPPPGWNTPPTSTNPTEGATQK